MERRKRSPGRVLAAVRLAVGLAASTALYYALRAAGVGVQAALVVGAVVAVVPALWSWARGRRPSGLSAFFTVLLVLGVLVSLLPGSPRFLLAKEAVLTGAAGAWFVASTRAPRPLAYQFSRPLAEGRLGWPGGWEELWASSPTWRRMWRVSSAVWGVGTLADAGLRVLLAYRLDPDRVPALNLVLVGVTVVLLNLVTNVYYATQGAFDRRGPLHRGGGLVGSAGDSALPA